jgi:hypothetical protein
MASLPPSERYAGLLAAALESESGVILPDEADRLALFRDRHNLTPEHHEATLQRLCCSSADFDTRVQRGEEVTTYLHVVAATLKEHDGSDANARLELYRSKHGIGEALHAAAMSTLAADPSRHAAPAAGARSSALSMKQEEETLAAAAVASSSGGGEDGGGSGGVGASGGTSVGELEDRLREREGENARMRVELEQATLELREMERRVVSQAQASPSGAAHVEDLQRQLDSHEETMATLHTSVSSKRERLKVVQELLDGREEELYETEEAVRVVERREQARTRELGAARAQLEATEHEMRRKQAELLRLSHVGDAGDARARTTPDWSPSLRVRGAAGRSEDGDVEARALREAAKVRSGGTSPGEDLSMADSYCARLWNVRIDELWDEVRRQRLPRSDWREFALARLVAPPEAASSFLGFASPLDALLAVDQAGRSLPVVAGTIKAFSSMRNAAVSSWQGWRSAGGERGAQGAPSGQG